MGGFKMKKFIAFLMTGLITVSLLYGCGSKQEGSNSGLSEGNEQSAGEEQGSDNSEEKIKVGISMISTTDEFCATMVDGMNQAVEELGGAVEIYLVDSVFDQAKQFDQIDTFISQGMDVAVVQPVNYNSSTSGIEALNNADIPVIEFCTNSEGGEYVYVGSSGYDSGYLQGQWVAENAPENATYVYLMCAMGETSQVDRKKGFDDALAESGRTDLKKLSEQSANAARDEGLKVTEDWIQAYGSFDMVVSQNDAMALGAQEALRSAGLDDTIILGIDGNKDAIESIKDGEFTATFLQQGYKMGYYTIMMAYWTATEDEKATGEDMIIPFALIDSSNCDEFLSMSIEDYIAYED